MSKIIIWDREESLKGIDKEVWFGSYPRSKSDTLVLVDDSIVYFLEDIKSLEGYTDGTDIEIVQRYVDDEEKKRLEEEKKRSAEIEREAEEIRRKELEAQELKEKVREFDALKEQLSAMKSVMDELMLNSLDEPM